MPPNTVQSPAPAAGGNTPSPVFIKDRKPLNIFLITTVIVTVLFIGSLIFGIWAYTKMLDYKNNHDKKVATAVELAKQETATEKDKEFVEKEKIPHKQYTAPDVLASVHFEYPKTWSAYVSEQKNTNSGTPLEAFIHPDFVPHKDSGTDFALRMEVTSRPYSEMLTQYESKVKQGKVKISPYKAPKVESVLGVRIEGEINKNQTDTMIMLPVRDKTLQIWTESQQFISDLDNIVLASLTFAP